MKRLLLLPALTALSLSAWAQADYTNSDEAAVGTTGVLYVVDSNATNYAATTGSGVTWDYSSIGGYNGETRDIAITDATMHTNASDFPTATHALSIEDFITNFYSVTATEKQMKGFLYNEPTFGELKAIFEDNNAHQLDYPFSLGNTITDDFSGSMNYVYVIPQSNAATGSIGVEYDGNGTLMLEGTTLTDVIRLKVIDTTSFTSPLGEVEFIREQYEYYHFATSNLPVFVHATVNISGPIELDFSLVMSHVDPSVDLGVEEVTELNKVSVYPNPNNGEFNINVSTTGAQKLDIQVMNAIGQVVESRNVAAKSGANTIKFNGADWNKGIYFVSINNGETKMTKKVLIK